jgi:outer membrane murein-binding lipoprotein Lpp
VPIRFGPTRHRPGFKRAVEEQNQPDHHCEERIMNKNDLKNPLIQSGAILLVVFLLISIVANSEPHGFLGSISGLASGILFLIGLFLAIFVSIAIIIGLFIAAVSIHSVDKARDLIQQLKHTLSSLYEKFGGGKTSRGTPPQQAFAAGIAGNAAPVDAGQFGQLAERLNTLQTKLHELHTHQSTAATALSALQRDVNELRHGIPAEESVAASPHPEHDHQDLAEQMQGIISGLDGLTARIDDLDQRLNGQLRQLEDDIDALRERTELPDVVSGILSYIDRPEDRELITGKAEEAVARGMTYAQIDEFFKNSLTPEVFEVLDSHPRLTKDFIRSVKKRFE